MCAGVEGEVVGPEGQEEVAVAVLWILWQGDGGSLQVDDDRSRSHIDHLAVVVGGRAVGERAGLVVDVAGIDQSDGATDEDGLGTVTAGDALDDVERRARVEFVGVARELEGDRPKDVLSAGGPYGSHDVGLGIEDDAAIFGA